MAKSKLGAQRSDVLLAELNKANVQCLVVGGLAAMMHGSSRMTEDLDLLVPIDVQNCQRILNALEQYKPCFYQTLGRPAVTRTAEELAHFKNLYFDTELGIVDFLGSLPPLGDYSTVSQNALDVEFAAGLHLKLIALDDLITVKEHVARPKDIAVAVELKAIRARLAVKPF